MFELDLSLKLKIFPQHATNHGMADWLDNLFEEIDKRAGTRQQERDWQIYCHKIIDGRSVGLYIKLVSRVQADVERINQRYSAIPSNQLDYNATGADFTVATKYFPQSRVSVHLDRGQQTVLCVFTRKLDRADSEDEDRTISLHFAVDPQSNLYLRHGRNPQTLEQISELLLAPLMLAGD